jgi:hypothetical protein
MSTPFATGATRDRIVPTLASANFTATPTPVSTRDRIVPTLASANFTATPSPVSTSLRAHLSSCDATLQREECGAVAAISGSKSCVLGQRTYIAGLGHQMSEVLMWLRHAHLENSSHIFELFGPIVAKEHGDSYEWANSFFGLVHAVRSMHGIVVNDVTTNSRQRYTNVDKTCHR